jgi:hypothetical protein
MSERHLTGDPCVWALLNPLSKVVTICTTCYSIQYVCFVHRMYLWDPHSTNQIIFVTVKQCVFLQVEINIVNTPHRPNVFIFVPPLIRRTSEQSMGALTKWRSFSFQK